MQCERDPSLHLTSVQGGAIDDRQGLRGLALISIHHHSVSGNFLCSPFLITSFQSSGFTAAFDLTGAFLGTFGVTFFDFFVMKLAEQYLDLRIYPWHRARFLVHYSGKRGVPQMIGARPIQVFNRRLQARREPTALQHVLCGEAFSHWPRRVSGKFLNGQVSISRPRNCLNTASLDAGVKPARTFATYISFRRS
jgi:hypothetical protein